MMRVRSSRSVTRAVKVAWNQHEQNHTWILLPTQCAERQQEALSRLTAAHACALTKIGKAGRRDAATQTRNDPAFEHDIAIIGHKVEEVAGDLGVTRA